MCGLFNPMVNGNRDSPSVSLAVWESAVALVVVADRTRVLIGYVVRPDASTRIVHDISSRNRAVALRDGHAELKGLAPPSSAVPVPLPFKRLQAPKRRAPVPNSTSMERAASLPTEGSSQQRIRDSSKSAHE